MGFQGLSRAFRIQNSINPRTDCNEHHTGQGFHALGGRNQHVGEYPEHTHDKQRRDNRVTGATEREFHAVRGVGATKQENRPDGQQSGRGPADKGVPYPEWDYREARYKKNWSWVFATGSPFSSA